MIGIEPPIDETLDLRTLLKRELHEKCVALDQNCYCNVCQKTVSTAIQTTYFYDPENYKDDIPKTLLINVLSCLDTNGRCKNPFNVPVEMDFTEFMYKSEIDEFKNKIYTATLTGFIQRIHCFPGQNVMGQDATFNGHYISTTKSPFSRDYYLSDDMRPMDPQNVGPDAIFDKSVPIVWLFYSIIEACEP